MDALAEVLDLDAVHFRARRNGELVAVDHHSNRQSINFGDRPIGVARTAFVAQSDDAISELNTAAAPPQRMRRRSTGSLSSSWLWDMEFPFVASSLLPKDSVR
jgi:hypothetical protein